MPGTMLSQREKAVLALIGTGKTSKEIALALRLSPATVADYRKQICHKLPLHSTAEVIAYALRNPEVCPQTKAKQRPLVPCPAPWRRWASVRSGQFSRQPPDTSGCEGDHTPVS